MIVILSLIRASTGKRSRVNVMENRRILSASCCCFLYSIIRRNHLKRRQNHSKTENEAQGFAVHRRSHNDSRDVLELERAVLEADRLHAI